MHQATQWPSTQGSLLMRLISPADKEAWQTFVQLYLPLVYRYCRLRGLQDADSCDVSQNVFKQVSRAIARFEYDQQRGRFRSWLGTITYREICHYKRRAQRAVPGAGDGIGDDRINSMPTATDTEWSAAFYAHLYEVAVSRIRHEFDEPTWCAFQSTWEQDQRPSDVARCMQKNAAWVYRAKYRVLQRIRKEIEFLSEDAAGLNM